MSNSEVRILHYGPGANFGGIERYVLSLSDHLSPQFHLDFVYSETGREPALRPYLAPAGSQFFSVPPRKRRPLANRTLLRQLFQSGRFDILHYHVNTASYITPLLFARRQGLPVVVHAHSSSVADSPVTRVLHQMNRARLSRLPIERLAVSEEAGRWLFGETPHRVIANGVDTSKFAYDESSRVRVRHELGLAEGDLALGHVGSFKPAKNHAHLLKIFAKVRALEPSARLLLVGDGPLRQTTLDQAEKLGIASAVTFLGRRSDVEDILSAMDVFVFPSLYEGSPLSVLEAQATGLPCVVSTAVPEETSHTSTVLRLSPAVGEGEWAVAILRSRAQRGPCISKGIPTMSDHVTALEDVYTTLLRPPRRSGS